MLKFSGYQINGTLHEGVETIIYRGQTPTDESPAILKVLKAKYPTLEAITRLKHEYQISQNLDSEQIVKAISLETFDHRLGIVLEDFGGESLAKLLERETLSLPANLNIAIQIIKALQYLHFQHIIHKDIKPSNIIINSQTKQVKLTDFGIATKLNKENPQFNNPNSVEGTLAYMSPEQTGRMNRTLDYRTDFYSLGITLYEMLTGKLPFPSNDPLEIVYSHIAVQPIYPHQINSEIPVAISEIVMKLMAKNAEDRYQSAAGLLADLENSLHQLETTGQIADFIPGRLDILSQLLIPQKLYGRENQVNQLLAAFERVGAGLANNLLEKPTTLEPKLPPSGTSELMLVSGYSGIGKSAVVNEVSKPITRSKGYFISGKFDQLKRNIPYASLIQAFNYLLRQLLTESAVSLEIWRTKILTALGTDGQVIADVIPKVELIIGKQPEVPEVSPTEAQNRFNRLFKEFLRVFAQKEHPLVIFLDDLQWADSATLKLIELMMTDNETQYLFLIGAYRDNEVNPAHPLMMMLDGLRNRGAIINFITLAPLEIKHINHLIADRLHGDNKSVKPLAELVQRKTLGNPFFANQFLKTLHAEKLITFDFQRHVFVWDISNIEAQDITDNVVDLMIGNLKKLPESTQQVLRLAACVGASFDLTTISIVCEKSKEAVFPDLVTAIQSGLILPTSELDTQLLIQDYKFLHDRVQQAGYALIDKAQKTAVHLQIGRLLLQNTAPKSLSEEIFEIVDHLNLGVEIVTDRAERYKIVKLNLIAGKKAKAATAYVAAVDYLNTGLNLLNVDSWQSNYDLTLALHEEAAEAAYLNGDFPKMEQLAEEVLNRAKTVLDKVKGYDGKIQEIGAQSKIKEGIQISLIALTQLGISLPEDPSQWDVQRKLKKTASLVADRDIEDLINLPLMIEPDKQAAQLIFSSIAASAFISAPALFILMMCEQVNLSIKYGNSR